MCDFENNYFAQVVNGIGINFEKTALGEYQTIFDEDSFSVQNRLQEFIESSKPAFNQVNFIEDFQELCSNIDLFKAILSGSTLKENEENDVFDYQDVNEISLFQVLLKFEQFQSQLIEYHLAKSMSYLMAPEDEALQWWLLTAKNLSCIDPVFKPDDLTKLLFQIFTVVATPVRLAILADLRSIVPMCSHSLAFQNLINYFSSDNQLNYALIDCLNTFHLSDGEKTHLISLLMKFINLENFRVIFGFLLSLRSNPWPKNDLKSLLKTSRMLLNDLIVLGTSENVDFFSVLNDMVNDSRVLDFWPSFLNIEFKNEHEPIDLMILIFVYRFENHQTKKEVLSIFRKKVQNRQFTFEHLKVLFEKFMVPKMLEELSKTILDLAMTILSINKTNSSHVIQFSMTVVQSFFQSSHSSEIIKIDAICQAIKFLQFIDLDSMVIVLEFIQQIVENHLEFFASKVQLFSPLLAKQNFMEVRELRITYRILGALLFGPNHNDMDPLREEIMISVRKHIGSSNESLRNRGIVIATTIVQFMAQNPNRSNQAVDFNSSEEYTATNLSSEYAKEAVALLEAINFHIRINNDAKCLFYDELSIIIQAEYERSLTNGGHLDKEFLKWLLDLTEIVFQCDFLKDDEIVAYNTGFKMTEQFRIHLAEHETDRVVINVSKLFETPPTENTCLDSVVYMAAIYRLYRFLRLIVSNGKLADIEALFTCAVSLPEFIENESFFESEWAELVDKGAVQTQILNCLFFTINWFREIVSTCINEKHGNFLNTVLKRTEQIIYLEKLFFQHLKTVENYKLPISYVPIYKESRTVNLSRPKKVSGTKKRHVSCTNAVLTIEKTQPTQRNIPFGNQNKKISLSSGFRKSQIEFRQIDLQFITYLKLPLVEKDVNSALKLKTFNFILNDTIQKLIVLFEDNQNLVHSLNTTLEEFIRKCHLYIENLLDIFDIVIFRVKLVLDQCNHEYRHEELFGEKVLDCKQSIQLILQFLSIYFAWDGFLEQTNARFLIDSLKKLPLVRKPDPPLSQHYNHKLLIDQYAKYFAQYTKEFCTLECAKYFLDLMNSFSKLQNDTKLKSIIFKSSGRFLKRDWYDSEGSIDYNTTVLVTFLKNYLSQLELAEFEDVLTKCAADLKSDAIDRFETFPCLKKNHFPMLYFELFNSFWDRIQVCFSEKGTSEQLKSWKEILRIWKKLMTMITDKFSRRSLMIFMKKSQIILKYFFKFAFPVFESTIKTKQSLVLEILHDARQLTSFLYRCCCHAKKTKDIGLHANVPNLRFSLETLVEKVKSLLLKNNLKDILWIGPLKNKALFSNEVNESDSSDSSDAENYELDDLIENDDVLDSDVESEIL